MVEVHKRATEQTRLVVGCGIEAATELMELEVQTELEAGKPHVSKGKH